ncbi:hypothetical protein ACFFJX_11585 [Pseudarcicella hirudinis]|uniref:hypothetical protein n=1 Tax=Pseudarcicella hirudinis TaxID=1079859 RepID=UPI0035EC8E35
MSVIDLSNYINIDKLSAQPIYLQIVEQIVSMIQNGILQRVLKYRLPEICLECLL